MPSGIFGLLWTTGIDHLVAHPNAVLNRFMTGIGLALIVRGIVRRYERLLLIPIGFRVMMGNDPLSEAAPDAEGAIHSP